MLEIKRVLNYDGIFVGSINGLQGLEKIKQTAKEIEPHFYFNKNKYIRLFNKEDLKKYLSIFEIIRIDDLETIRFNHKKKSLIFLAKKTKYNR
ncbi:MAG: hypothetical protein HFI09_03140 [Bacilli bacterium]|nr:hypothetical protein [Bacilli bacterium]